MITAGVSLSLSGRYALQGRQALAGLQAWVADVNAGGGLTVPGRPSSVQVRLVGYDDRSSRQGVVANVTRLVDEDRADLLFGPYASDLTRKAVRVAGPRGRVLWNHGGSSDEIAEMGARVVGIATPASRYYERTLERLHELHPTAGRVAYLFGERGQFGRQILRGVDATARRCNLTVVPLPYTTLAGESEALLAALRAHACDLLLSGGAFADEVALARALAYHRPRPAAVAFVGAALQEFGVLLGADAERTYGPSQWEREVGTPVTYGPAPAEVALSIEHAGGDADYVAAQAYAAGLIAQRCLETAVDRSDEALWAAACAQDFTTFFGRFKLDPGTGRQVGHEMVTIQWRDGRKHIVRPSRP